VVAPDPVSVVIRWKQPYPEADLLGTGFQPLPRHILETAFREQDPLAFPALPFWSTEYVGLGPYRLDGWEPGASIAGVAFDGHVFGRPKIDRIRVVFIPDPQTALANILAGEVHYVGTLIFTATEGETMEQQWAQNQAGRVLYSATGFRSANFQVRPEAADPPELTDVRMRRALAFAIDKRTAVDILSAGKGLLTHTITAPTVEYYPEIERVIQKYDYDPRRSQQLFEEIGFVRGPDGLFARRDGRPMKIGVWSSAGTKNEQEAATYIDGLRRAGVDASQNVIAAAQIGDAQLRALIPGITLRGGGPGLNGLTSAEIARPENRWNGGNRYGWSNAEYDRAFDNWTKSLAQADRVRYVAEMERIITEDLPILPNYFEASVTAALSSVEGPTPRQNPDAGPQLATLHRWSWR
jgi:peptide/nickel transport system substrate-binding protein